MGKHRNRNINFIVSAISVFLLFQTTNAIIVVDGKIVPAWPQEVQHSALAKQSAGNPSTPLGFFPHPRDTTYGVVMIVDFSDQQAKFTKEQVNDWLNKKGYSSSYANGSVYDYFNQISNGKFNLLNDVFGYYRAKNPKSYYENSSGYDKAYELVNEMVTYFDPMVDFSKYDNDKNGTTESISFVYAGAGQTWGQGLWPHSGWVGKKLDGVNLGSYNMSDMGSGLGLYVFCHETGHMVFGWPDLYWFGDYCIMGNRMSDANPVPVNDFFRADQGWIPAKEITANDNLLCTTTPNQMAYFYRNPSNKKQMFLWSEIKNSGRYSTLKGKGILLYKFDSGISGNTSGTSRQLYVVEADGNNAMAKDQWPSPGSASSDFFFKGNNAEFSSTSKPASLWGLKIYNVSAASDTMTFYTGTGTVPVLHHPANVLNLPANTVQTYRYNLAGRCERVLQSGITSRSSGFYIMSLPAGIKKDVETR
jgi:M6 family metalloprotease-like protein